MMIESMAGKSGALHGVCHDATPFQFSEDEPAIDYFGKLLVKGRNCRCTGIDHFGKLLDRSKIRTIDKACSVTI